MLNISAKDRCKKCHTERALRLCARSGKGICWRCCNLWRVDEKCPQDCPYSAKISADSPLPAFKSDNSAEYNDIYQRYLDLWVGRKNPLLQDKSPLQYAAENSSGMLKFLGNYLFPDDFPMAYLMQKLALPHSQNKRKENPEEAAIRYLERFIARDFEDLAELSINFAANKKQKDAYNKYMQELSFLKKIKQISPIHTGVNPEAGQCLVFVELNFKSEWCMILSLHKDKWYVAQNINGNPAKYYQQNELYKKIAALLQARKMDKVQLEIAEALRTYVDSADLYNLRALSRGIEHDTAKAKKDFFTAMALDASFIAPYINYCIILLNNNELEKAGEMVQTALQYDPQNPEVMNLQAVYYAASGDRDTATRIWREILKKHPDYENAKRNLAQR